MGKKATQKGMTQRAKSKTSHGFQEIISYRRTTYKPEHIDMPNVKVTQKVRKAQESRRNLDG